VSAFEDFVRESLAEHTYTWCLHSPSEHDSTGCLIGWGDSAFPLGGCLCVGPGGGCG
jgi:hypothetical protein